MVLGFWIFSHDVGVFFFRERRCLFCKEMDGYCYCLIVFEVFFLLSFLDCILKHFFLLTLLCFAVVSPL